MAVLAAVYLGVATLVWIGLVAGVGRWGKGWELPRPAAPPPERGAVVSVCIPARDEAGNISAAVTSALSARWPAIEVVVVDDRSTDGTARIARGTGGGDPRLRVVAGDPLPARWAGKPWACARAAREAGGEVLLFMDADVSLDPDAPRALLAALDARDLAMVSAFGAWDLRTFWERALVPAVGWLIRGAIDLDGVNGPARPVAFANGQLLMVRRVPYESVGGHGAVRDQVLDDVRLAETLKRAGHRIGLLVAPWAFRVRQYRSLHEIVAGYSKNLYEGMGRRPVPGLCAAALVLALGALPAPALLACLLCRAWPGLVAPGPAWLSWLAVVCGLQVLFRWRLERRDCRSGVIAWAHPLANLLLALILVRSVLGARSRWKGRQFVGGRAR